MGNLYMITSVVIYVGTRTEQSEGIREFGTAIYIFVFFSEAVNNGLAACWKTEGQSIQESHPFSAGKNLGG